MRVSHAMHIGMRVGIAQDRPDGKQIAAARGRADQCLDLGPPDRLVVSFEEVHGRAVLADTQGFIAGHPQMITAALRRLVEHDRERGTEYTRTLRVYLDTFGDVTRTARLLEIHGNTLRYRVRRIEELTETDLNDGDARLSLELQLRALSDAADQ